MTTTESSALEAMRAHHAQLTDGVARRVAAISASIEGSGGTAPAAAALVAFIAREVLPHAAAEEQTIYEAAARIEGLAEVVAAMVEEHRQLTASVDRLAIADDAGAAATEAEAIGSLFARHVAKENELLLPPLAADHAADLGALLSQMHHLTERSTQDTSSAHDAAGPDIEASLLTLVLEAAERLTKLGEVDPACRMVAGTWATLRVGRPDLATRSTAALHRLVRSATAAPVAFEASRPAPAGSGGEVLDARALAPARRHDQIFLSYDALAPGDGFVLVNDHDPKPLRYQFEAEHAGDFTWDYLEAGPRTWRVRIGRSQDGAAR